ncbi:MAG: TIR domain-containing protein [Paludibacteraceae bacterium]|nr:TIR domain-containing protein [Paludibacteraceae bacterium]
MGRKIFVSYKYADDKVLPLSNYDKTTVRNYVDKLQDLIEETDNINKGEDDGEDMSSLADATIGSKLGDKIFDSSVTLVLISKGMRENKPEKDQWIPWEISYSLKEQSRQGGRSKTNAMLAVVLPDENGSYDYFITDNFCSRTLHTDFLFDILKKNMFNEKIPNTYTCQSCGRIHYRGESSYIKSVKWDDFYNKQAFNKYIDDVIEIKNHINDYKITKNL